MNVRVFRNLTRDCYSIQARLAGGWRTVAHAQDVLIRAPRFHVSEAGRRRVVATGKKTVHAWIQGDLVGYRGEARPGFAQHICAPCKALAAPPYAEESVTYNPRRFASFVFRNDSAPIHDARFARLGEKGLTACP